jgi:methionyl-tRNA synthetase
MAKKFYITTTIPYVNAAPHIGFALELIQTDVIARYHQLLGAEVEFSTGTDEHGSKIYKKALEAGKDPQVYADEYAARFKQLSKALNISNTRFVRTSDSHHKAAAQEFWNRCFKSGDIYKANYKTKYCIGCELEKTDSELVDGCCPLHPNLIIEEREEENYFFKFSKYQKPLLELYKNNPKFVLPDFRLNEIKRFVEDGLKDFSVSRLKDKMPWGVPVPNDPDHVMYVWFDALVNYISTLGWPEDERSFFDFWPGTQTAGKDNLRQQSAIWQAMLLSAGLPNSKQILIHGFINIGGQKMSKSLGNVTDPFQVVEKYGAEVLRYYLLRAIPSDEDGDFSEKNLIERYNGDLANGLGNLISRVATLIENNLNNGIVYDSKKIEPAVQKAIEEAREPFTKGLENFRLHESLAAIWQLISFADRYVNDNKPWALAKEDSATAGEKFETVMLNLVEMILRISFGLAAFMPETADKISEIFDFNPPAGGRKGGLEGRRLKVQKGKVLFPRLEH